MKRNVIVSVLSGFFGSAMLLILLSAAGIVGAALYKTDRVNGADVARSDVSRVEAVAAATLTSTFTYQGQLISSGSPVSNTCDFQFSLYDALSAGNRIGITQTVSSLSVSRGLFTALLNGGNEFGNTAFNGDARWLQIAVRCPDSGSYTAMSTRQPLTSLPFALPGLRTFPNATSPNIIGGYSGNFISTTMVGSVIGGGGVSGAENRVQSNYATVGGGLANIASGPGASVSGGYNIASNWYATVAGGDSNNAGGDHATIGGGGFNIASNNYATVGGGQYITASGFNATVPGGYFNTAAGDYSFAAGQHAKANHNGSFVWADSSTGAEFVSTGNDQFLIRATGGVGIGTTTPSEKLTVAGLISTTGGVKFPDGTTQITAFYRPALPGPGAAATVDSAGYVGEYSSITIGADGLGLISYYDFTNGDLKVLHCGNASCSSGTATTVDSAGAVGPYTSITIGADGLGLISYYDFTTDGDLKVLHCGNVACSGGNISTTVDSAGTVGQYTSITIGADGLGLIRPHVPVAHHEA